MPHQIQCKEKCLTLQQTLQRLRAPSNAGLRRCRITRVWHLAIKLSNHPKDFTHADLIAQRDASRMRHNLFILAGTNSERSSFKPNCHLYAGAAESHDQSSGSASCTAASEEPAKLCVRPPSPPGESHAIKFSGLSGLGRTMGKEVARACSGISESPSYWGSGSESLVSASGAFGASPSASSSVSRGPSSTSPFSTTYSKNCQKCVWPCAIIHTTTELNDE